MNAPKGWQRLPIKNVYKGLFDGPHATPPIADDGPVFLGIKNITDDGHLALNDVRHIAEEDFARWTKRVTPQAGDIVFTYEATLNRYARIPEDFRGCLGRRLALIRPNDEVVDPRFLHFYFFGQDWRETIEANKLSGATVDRIPLTGFPNFPINLPPLPAQKRIASILSAYDDLIENNTRRIAILEEMARRLYEEWFVHFRFPGHEDATFIDTEDGKIPKDWCVKSIGEMTSHVRYGYTAKAQSKAEGPKFLRITDIVPNEISWESVPYCEISEKNLDKYTLEEGDIVVARTGATTGYAKRLNKKFPRSVFASYLVRMRFPNQILSRYFGMIMESENYKKFIHQHMSGAAQPNANAQVLTSMRATVPTDELLEEFDKKIKPITDAKEVLQLKSANARSQRDLLLPKLISGEIDVSKAEEVVGGEAA